MSTTSESRSFNADDIHANQTLFGWPYHNHSTLEDQVEQLVKKIKENMASKSREGDQVQELTMIDAIQRLGLQYYFQEDINAALNKIISSKMDECGDNLHDGALRFRLLRQAGYNVEAETLSKFKNKEGKLKKEVEQDTKGLLSLFEASQLITPRPGDDILDEAAVFTWDLLKTTALKSVEKSETAMIRNTLSNPCHKSLPKLAANNDQVHDDFDTSLIKFLHYDCHEWIKEMQDLATIDTNMAQITFKDEITQVSRWWKELGVTEVLELARNEPVKWHMWSSVALPNPAKAEIRTELTKTISFIYLIDDIFDVYGTIEDLTLFTRAVNRWEFESIEGSLLPNYMKTCLKALFETTDEMSHKIYIKHGWNPKDVIQKAWAELCNAFLVEARWFASEHLPTTEEYLKNGIVSSGVYVVFVSLLCLLSDTTTTDDPNHHAHLCNTHPDIVTLTGTLLRLWDDLGSAKDEDQDGHDGSFVACYMNEHQGSSDEIAREYVMDMISDAWKSLNEECLGHSPFSYDFKTAFLNLSRMIPIMYKYDDDHRLPHLEKHMKSLLCE